MRLWVGVTDFDWFRFLATRPGIDEVNFWQPSGGVEFKALSPGEPFLFKLHSPRNFIVGGGFFAHWSPLPVSLAWDAFGEKNGATSLSEMRSRLAKCYRSPRSALF
jgi:putative restriction endonuclease